MSLHQRGPVVQSGCVHTVLTAPRRHVCGPRGPVPGASDERRSAVPPASAGIRSCTARARGVCRPVAWSMSPVRGPEKGVARPDGSGGGSPKVLSDNDAHGLLSSPSSDPDAQEQGRAGAEMRRRTPVFRLSLVAPSQAGQVARSSGGTVSRGPADACRPDSRRTVRQRTAGLPGVALLHPLAAVLSDRSDRVMLFARGGVPVGQ